MPCVHSKPYVCNRCGFETDRKDTLKAHAQRKNTCPPTKSDIPIEEIRAQLGCTPPQKPVCSLCGKLNDSRQALHEHVKHSHNYREPSIAPFKKAALHELSQIAQQAEPFLLVVLYRCVFGDPQNSVLVTIDTLDDRRSLRCVDMGSTVKLPAAEVLSGALAKAMAKLASYMQHKGMRVPLVLQCEAESKHMQACLEQVSVIIQLQAARGAGCLDQLLVDEAVWSAVHNPFMSCADWKGAWTL